MISFYLDVEDYFRIPIYPPSQTTTPILSSGCVLRIALLPRSFNGAGHILDDCLLWNQGLHAHFHQTPNRLRLCDKFREVPTLSSTADLLSGIIPVLHALEERVKTFRACLVHVRQHRMVRSGKGSRRIA